MKTPAKPLAIAFILAAALFIASCSPFDDELSKTPPVAKFSYTSEMVYPAHVQFSNTSVSQPGTTSTFVWDFGDGSATSTVTDPSHDYVAPGVFNVKLVEIPSAGGNDTLIQSLRLPVETGPSGTSSRQNTAAFNFAVNYSGLQATFTNVSSYAGGFLWNFGDGGTSTTDSVTVKHTYTVPGTYHVVLTANGVSSNDTSGVVITF